MDLGEAYLNRKNESEDRQNSAEEACIAYHELIDTRYFGEPVSSKVEAP